MPDVVIVEAVRSAVGKRRGGLAHCLAPDLFSDVLAGLINRAGIDSAVVGQVTGGCVSQVDQQSNNVTRNAWLAAGLDRRTPGSTIHSQCGSSQQAFTLASGLVAGGVHDVAVVGGVESMDQAPMGTSVLPEYGPARTPRYEERYEITTQFEAADRIAEAWGLSRDQLDEFAVLSQTRAAEAVAAGRFTSQIVPIDAGDNTMSVDEGARPTMREGLAGLRLNQAILDRNGLSHDDIDVIEINEAFASVVLAWAHDHESDLAKVNVNGGAIALGHPLGATGGVLLTKALNELERTGGRFGLVTMCVGGGMGTGTLIERL